jgi:hypothetical protein
MHFNSLPTKNLDSLPFYAWQCITLKLAHREVDLAFKDEIEQNDFVRALIYQINTVDGAANSGKTLVGAIVA